MGMSSLKNVAVAGALAALALALAACSQDGPGKAVITDRCVAGGESPEICKCLADQSAARLDKEMFQIVVFGAKGEENAGERLLRDIGPDRQARFTAMAREIARACGAPDYPVME
jgi:hypothetical protein